MKTIWKPLISGQKKLSYHFSSHILHSIFWTNLTNKSTLPKDNLLKRIEKSFGSFDRLKVLIAATSKNVDGKGWGILLISLIVIA
jgi:Fe-Mn family superoxide dismutase